MTYSGSNYRGAASVPPSGGPQDARVAEAASGPTRRGLIGSAVGLVASLAAAGGGVALWTTTRNANENLDRPFDLEGIPEDGRPDKLNGAMNLLIIGSDARSDDQENARSDTSILMHVNEDGTEAYGISIPRDLYVYIPEFSDAEFYPEYTGAKDKFNSAYAWGGTPLTVMTVEELSGTRVDHVVEIDFPGLVKVVDALGGVEMDIEWADAPDYYDESGVTSIHEPYRFFPAGPNTLTGEEALDYVRQRYQWVRGDFARMQHQQELIKAIMDSATSSGVLTSQSTLRAFIESVSGAVKVDTEFNVVETGIGLIGLRSDDIEFVTTPNLGAGSSPVGSAVFYYEDEDNNVPNAEAAALWEAVREDRVGRWMDDQAEEEDSEEGE
ncbi:LCP family protein [Glycomyces salinus]|uniref:LCP family protein n=1 Tax=Glycomyces salinus TaxID=980294 RepID=UPI0018ED8570|nr:LCP family protein [Glycomyces salinus]